MTFLKIQASIIALGGCCSYLCSVDGDQSLPDTCTQAFNEGSEVQSENSIDFR